MSLKTIVGQKIMDIVIKSQKKGATPDWRVLVVDELSMRMISACTKMHDLAQEGITIVEDINKKREPLQHLEAVYLVQPTEKSINGIINDFGIPTRTMYRAAHIFFTEACPDDCFNMLVNANVSKYVKALKEINIAFLPQESQVFSLDCEETFPVFYGPSRAPSRPQTMERMAQQLATLCAVLGEYPNVRYRSDFDYNVELAQMVQQKLDAYKADEPTMGESPEKVRTPLGGSLAGEGFPALAAGQRGL